jgi:hypothetical protein
MLPHLNRRSTIISFILLISIAITVLLGVTLHRPTSSMIPANIQKQLSFVLYVPDDKDAVIERSSIHYANGDGVLSYTVGYNPAHAEITITQQATPSVFTDVPQYYPTLLDRLNQYASLGTINGTVYLTKPTELKGQQQAVLNDNGTLLFAHPGNRNLSNDDWRRFFNSLQTVRP